MPTKKLSHEQYLAKLLLKNIEVYPLQEYINSTTKIIHKCTCGNTWNVIPKSVLKNIKCGCRNNFLTLKDKENRALKKIKDKETLLKEKHKEYLQKLQDKNIKIVPLEPYIRSNDSILHKCECGKEYQQTPKRALLNNKCGCNVSGRQKPTTESFNKKLRDKGFKTKIVGAYNDIFEKTMCLCECGKEWETTPQSLLKGSNCGCRGNGLAFTHERYLSELANKNIKIVPMEPYKGMQTKILHKCTCGNTWNITPSMVVNRNDHCGCRKLLQEEEIYKGKPTVLYYLKIGELYKIGLAMMQRYKTKEKAIEVRYRSDIKLGLEYKIIDSEIYEDGLEALYRERKILSENLEYQYVGEKVLIGGNTELFVKDIRKLGNFSI